MILSSLERIGKNWKVFLKEILSLKCTSWHPVGTQLASSIENIDKLIVFCVVERSFGEMLSFMNYTDRTKFRRKYIQPLLEDGVLEHTIPDKPNSKNQKYRLTEKG